MAFYESNICEVMIFRVYTVHNKHERINLAIKSEKNCKHYRKGSNNFSADCTLFSAAEHCDLISFS